jgi:hypothetical protein
VILFTLPLSVVYGHGAAWEATTEHESTGLKFFDRGAVLVELAFALPLVMMLILGMVSAGIAFNHQLALTHAAREGGRFAATLPVTNFGSGATAMNAWLDEVAARVVEDATGSLDPGTPGLVVCVAYVHPKGIVPAPLTTARRESGGGPGYNSVPCFENDGRPPEERRVQVVVARDTEFNVLVFSSTLTIDAGAVNRFEAAGGF